MNTLLYNPNEIEAVTKKSPLKTKTAREFQCKILPLSKSYWIIPQNRNRRNILQGHKYSGTQITLRLKKKKKKNYRLICNHGEKKKLSKILVQTKSKNTTKIIHHDQLGFNPVM